MVMVGMYGKASEVAVAACRMRRCESFASRVVVGDEMARVTSTKIAMKAPGDSIGRRFA